MSERDKRASVLTKTSRRWLSGGEPPTHPDKVRQRTHERIRNLISEDGELLMSHLEDGELNPETVVSPLLDEYGHKSLGDGIRDVVAMLYIIGQEARTLDAEEAINRGLEKGKQGRLDALESKLDNVGVDGMSIGELNDLAESDRLDGRAARELKQDYNIGEFFGLPDELADLDETDDE
jgi:hypothetical protein